MSPPSMAKQPISPLLVLDDHGIRTRTDDHNGTYGLLANCLRIVTKLVRCHRATRSPYHRVELVRKWLDSNIVLGRIFVLSLIDLLNNSLAFEFAV